MLAGLATILSIYLIRIIMIRQFGLAELGIYQSAFNLSGILAQFVLTAMTADYYPRLTAVAGDNESVHRIVNEQSQISTLLSLPGLAVMMIFAPLIIKLFYATSFITAVPIMRWCILGVLGRVFSWPIGFIMAAKGYGKLYLGTEFFACSLHVIAVYIFIGIWGLDGAGVAFMALYIVYTALMLFVMRRLVGAIWDRDTMMLNLKSTSVMILLMLNCTLNSDITTQWLINIIVVVIVTILCFKQLSRNSDIGIHTLLDKLRHNK
jgi:antigen flippase